MILVHDKQRYRRAQRNSVLGAREDPHAIFFIARGYEIALAGATATQLWLNISFGERHAGRDAINDAADTRTV